MHTSEVPQLHLYAIYVSVIIEGQAATETQPFRIVIQKDDLHVLLVTSTGEQELSVPDSIPSHAWTFLAFQVTA